MLKKTILFFLASFLFVACTEENQEESHLDPKWSGEISSDDSLLYEFGDINIEGGLVSHTFSFTNSGDTPLYLYDMSTSCMCTEAQYILPDGTSSPTFGMDTDQAWSTEIAPGEDFQVLVTYDPMAHGPDAVGEINRSIIFHSSSIETDRIAVLDPELGTSFTQINIHGMVLSAEDYKTADPEALE